MRTSGRYESAESGSNIGTAVTFLLIGLGAGALMGLMFAPKPGKQFRRDLQRGYEDAKDNFGDWADEAKDRVREVRRSRSRCRQSWRRFRRRIARPRRAHSPRHETQLESKIRKSGPCRRLCGPLYLSDPCHRRISGHYGSSTSRAPSLTPGRVSRCHGTLPCIMLEKLRLGLKTPRTRIFAK